MLPVVGRAKGDVMHRADGNAAARAIGHAKHIDERRLSTLPRLEAEAVAGFGNAAESECAGEKLGGALW